MATPTPLPLYPAFQTASALIVAGVMQIAAAFFFIWRSTETNLTSASASRSSAAVDGITYTPQSTEWNCEITVPPSAAIFCAVPSPVSMFHWTITCAVPALPAFLRSDEILVFGAAAAQAISASRKQDANFLIKRFLSLTRTVFGISGTADHNWFIGCLASTFRTFSAFEETFQYLGGWDY